MRGRWWAGGLLVAVAVAVAGCSGSGGSGGSSGALKANGDAVNGADRAAAPVPAAASAAASASAGGASTGSVTVTGVRLSTGSLIRTAEITVSVKKGSVPARADDANAIAQRAGGEVDADDRTSGSSPSARLQLRVPPAQLTAVLTALSRLGHEDSRTLSTKDVTTQVADVNARAISARAAIARLTALYARSTKVGDVISIENELAQRQADLESLEAQQKALADQTSLATVSVYLHNAAVVVAKKKTKHHAAASGFTGGLSAGWHAFTSAAHGVATGVGAALPFLAVLVLALLAARLLWGRFGRRRPAPEPTVDPI